jgi:MOSC domain-containing protein YiiM
VAPLRDLLADVPQPGRLTWIGLRTSRRGPIDVVEVADAEPGVGLRGDRRTTGARAASPGGRRQVTLIQAEHLPVIAALLGRHDPVDPALLRRNLVVAGINLQALSGRRFRVGRVILEASGACHPCSRMEDALGPGGHQAVRGHGGITARVLSPGALRLGDEVDLLPPGDGPLGTTAPSDDATRSAPVGTR